MTKYQPPISTLAEVRHLWQYLGAASQCNLLREFGIHPSDDDSLRLEQVERLFRADGDWRARICEFVEEVADTVRGL